MGAKGGRSQSVKLLIRVNHDGSPTGVRTTHIPNKSSLRKTHKKDDWASGEEQSVREKVLTTQASIEEILRSELLTEERAPEPVQRKAPQQGGEKTIHRRD